MLDLAIDIGVRGLGGAIERACAAKGFQNVIHRILDRFRVEARAQLDRQVVEGAGSVDGAGKSALGHPGDAEILVVWNHAARPDGIDEFR